MKQKRREKASSVLLNRPSHQTLFSETGELAKPRDVYKLRGVAYRGSLVLAKRLLCNSGFILSAGAASDEAKASHSGTVVANGRFVCANFGLQAPPNKSYQQCS
jgi:hypothetical protein